MNFQNNNFNINNNFVPPIKNLVFSMQNNLPRFSFYGQPMNVEGYRYNNNINQNYQNNRYSNQLFSP